MSQAIDALLKQLQLCAPVSKRAMFGGYGLYIEGLMFGLVADDRPYFKCDRHNLEHYQSAGCTPFIYDRKSKPVQMSYYSVPESILNNPQALTEWVESARQAAARQKRKTAKTKAR
ncbi:MAG: TfoX/Sxy family protein [Cyanobacteria bacterium P01_A01_bin.3]